MTTTMTLEQYAAMTDEEAEQLLRAEYGFSHERGGPQTALDYYSESNRGAGPQHRVTGDRGPMVPTGTTRQGRKQMSFRAKVPPVVARYYEARGGMTEHPIIAQTFVSGRGWKRHPIRKRVSKSWCQKLRQSGVEHVALAMGGGPLADFTVRELISGR